MQLLRIEGVNLSFSIDDTEDLSTRRGGSLMLLEVIDEIRERNIAHLKRISTGASTGLFEVTGSADTATKTIRNLLVENDRPYRYGTFVLDSISGDEGFPALERAVVAANRWRQMQSLSFSPHGLGASIKGVCSVDEVRPASEQATVQGVKNQPVSASVKARLTSGAKSKHRFYSRILDDGHYDHLEFTNDFHEIANASSLELQPATLDGKLAIFYADGNGFGDIARRCKTVADLKKWDGYVKGQRKALLSALLDHASNSKRPYWRTSEGQLRLETLLWGGDELMFAVPGWCGMELARLFVEQTQGMEYEINNSDSKSKPHRAKQYKAAESKRLTHACGLVFCHHQAPISRISHLAKALADKGKEANRAANSLNWVVLESFDHTGSGLDDYLMRRFGPRMKWSDLALHLDALMAMTEVFPTLRKELPRSAIVRITGALSERRASDAGADEDPLMRSARLQLAEKGGDAFSALWPRLHPKGAAWADGSPSCDDLGAWAKLAELWDYCPDWNGSSAEQGD